MLKPRLLTLVKRPKDIRTVGGCGDGLNGVEMNTFLPGSRVYRLGSMVWQSVTPCTHQHEKARQLQLSFCIGSAVTRSQQI